MKRIISYILGIGFVLSMMVALLFVSIELAAFSDMGFYKSQYEKNNVYRYIDVEEETLLEVTEHLLKYTKGKESDLDIVVTNIHGEEISFFNQKEKDHMVDVQGLVVGSVHLGRVLVVLMVGILFVLYQMKENSLQLLSRCIVFTMPVIILFTAGLALLISQDFTNAFIIFHEMLFTNDLWLLDPDVDRLINMVPEPFFSTVAFRIGVIFCTTVGTIYAVAISLFYWYNGRQKKG